MNGEWLCAVVAIERVGGGQQREGRLSCFDGVSVNIGILEDRHEAVAGRLIDVAAGLVDAIEKG